MVPQNAIPEPFVLNLLKHHIVFATQLLKNYEGNDEAALRLLMSRGGNLWCDYYFGLLDPASITREVKHFLVEKGVFENKKYREWIAGARGTFRNMFLSDGSEWTLLSGTDDDRYIHVHPARYSKFTMRVRFMALKTAILAMLFDSDIISDFHYEKINFIRQTYLNAPPVKQGGDISHLQKIEELLKSCTAGRGFH